MHQPGTVVMFTCQPFPEILVSCLVQLLFSLFIIKINILQASSCSGWLKDTSLPVRLTGVHREDLVISEQRRDILLVLSQHVGIECTWGQCQNFCLVCQRLHDTWVTVSLVDGAVCTEKVIISLAFHVPHKYTWRRKKFNFSQNNFKDQDWISYSSTYIGT